LWSSVCPRPRANELGNGRRRRAAATAVGTRRRGSNVDRFIEPAPRGEARHERGRHRAVSPRAMLPAPCSPSIFAAFQAAVQCNDAIVVKSAGKRAVLVEGFAPPMFVLASTAIDLGPKSYVRLARAPVRARSFAPVILTLAAIQGMTDFSDLGLSARPFRRSPTPATPPQPRSRRRPYPGARRPRRAGHRPDGTGKTAAFTLR